MIEYIVIETKFNKHITLNNVSYISKVFFFNILWISIIQGVNACYKNVLWQLTINKSCYDNNAMASDYDYYYK